MKSATQTRFGAIASCNGLDQRHRDRRVLLEQGQPLGSALGMEDGRPVSLEHAGQRVDVADVVVDDERRLASHVADDGADLGDPAVEIDRIRRRVRSRNGVKLRIEARRTE